MNDECSYISLIKEGCQSWRQGDDQKGINCFQQACLLWIDHLEEQERTGERLPEESFNRLIQSMEKLMETLNGHDIIRATDILEYDILLLVKSMESQKTGVEKF
ncbi:hypothetical protein DNHGIG_20200 [Collibacillus ludicampi]|jgi:hypothetical protein|uniref:Uncharacterized protein n=1 Tax=Collibacillus ludicampi TaxID=2771369 RepID=A0AAV4LF88_9BACL|nr:hypothetical protein [Collibacillus ludicampi]GIM46471.1 hypothetical protein DNHGIG_20200 [Collibacillus ludicampi]